MLSSRFSKFLSFNKSFNMTRRLFSKCPVHNAVASTSTTGTTSGSCPYHPYSSKPLVRSPAPEFKGTAWWNGQFKVISNEEFKGKWICLFFYPLDFTFVCPTEIVDFDKHSGEFAKNSNLFLLISRLPSDRLLSRFSFLTQRIRS